MNDDQLTILVYAILIVIVVPGLYGLVYIENGHSFAITDADSLEYVSVEKPSLSEVSVTNNRAQSDDMSFSMTVVTVSHSGQTVPDVHVLSGVSSASVRSPIQPSTTLSVYSIVPLKSPHFQKKSYAMSETPIAERINSDFDPFVITVDTRIDDGGYTDNDTFIVQTGAEKYTYNYSVYWEDKQRTNLQSDTTLEFETPGVHQIAITRKMPHLQYDRLYVDQGLGKKITAINQWGDVRWRSFEKSFRNTPNMRAKYSDSPDLTRVTSIDRMFEGNMSNNGSVNEWETGNVTSMRAVFAHARSFNKPIDRWDTENVTTMYAMFQQADSFNQSIRSWDVRNVSNMESMFLGADSFNEDISALCVPEVSTEPKYFARYSKIEYQPEKNPQWGTACS